MKVARKDMILHTVQCHNILPITSACNTACIFCSHKYNPLDLDVYKLPPLSLDDIRDMVTFLNKGKKIIIGESATRIIEGEPFVRKDILEILDIIRGDFKDEIIEITTNGTGLSEDIVKSLKQYEPLELNVSLNSSSEIGRENLLRDKKPIRAIEGIKLLKKYDIKYHGSIVAMPMVVGYDDIKGTIEFLDKYGCSTIRMFIPGFAKNSDVVFDFYDLREELNDFINEISKTLDTIVLLEPPIIEDLKARVYGVLKDSNAYNSNIVKDDIILKVNDKEVYTRVDAFNKIYNLKDPKLKILRGDKVLDITLKKDNKSSPGFIMHYDISYNVKEDILGIVNRYNSKNPLVLTSELGKNIIDMLFKDTSINIDYVKNNYFGGSIKSAGLLVVDDIIEKINEIKNHYNPDLIIIPSNLFNYKDKDLMGKSYYDIEKRVGIKVEIV